VYFKYNTPYESEVDLNPYLNSYLTDINKKELITKFIQKPELVGTFYPVYQTECDKFSKVLAKDFYSIYINRHIGFPKEDLIHSSPFVRNEAKLSMITEIKNPITIINDLGYDNAFEIINQSIKTPSFEKIIDVLLQYDDIISDEEDKLIEKILEDKSMTERLAYYRYQKINKEMNSNETQVEEKDHMEEDFCI